MTQSLMTPNKVETKISAHPHKPEVTITSHLDAPPHLVWKTITDPNMLPRWWGPREYTTTVEKMDVKPGGKWHFIQRSADGKLYGFSGIYKEVNEHTQYSYTFNYEATPGHESTETITLEEHGFQTKLTNNVVFQTMEDRDSMVREGLERGAVESMERLNTLLQELKNAKAGVQEVGIAEDAIAISRIMLADQNTVWKAWTQKTKIKHWWGPKGFTAPYIENDLRVGGKYLYLMRSSEGKEVWNTGTYMEVVPKERIVATDSFANAKGTIVPATEYGFSADFPRELYVTVTFENMGKNKTKLTIRQAGLGKLALTDHASMIEGWNSSLDKLEKCLRTAPAKPATKPALKHSAAKKATKKVAKKAKKTAGTIKKATTKTRRKRK
jgi:uncharacterized protein YndB with AHSA1/START domain